MGWRADGGLWLLVRGGGLFLSKGTGVSEIEDVPLHVQLLAMHFVQTTLLENMNNGFELQFGLILTF